MDNPKKEETKKENKFESYIKPAQKEFKNLTKIGEKNQGAGGGSGGKMEKGL